MINQNHKFDDKFLRCIHNAFDNSAFDDIVWCDFFNFSLRNLGSIISEIALAVEATRKEEKEDA